MSDIDIEFEKVIFEYDAEYWAERFLVCTSCGTIVHRDWADKHVELFHRDVWTEDK